METVKVLNIDIQNTTRRELLENLTEGVLVTPNLDHLIKLKGQGGSGGQVLDPQCLILD